MIIIFLDNKKVEKIVISFNWKLEFKIILKGMNNRLNIVKFFREKWSFKE